MTIITSIVLTPLCKIVIYYIRFRILLTPSSGIRRKSPQIFAIWVLKLMCRRNAYVMLMRSTYPSRQRVWLWDKLGSVSKGLSIWNVLQSMSHRDRFSSYLINLYNQKTYLISPLYTWYHQKIHRASSPLLYSTARPGPLLYTTIVLILTQCQTSSFKSTRHLFLSRSPATKCPCDSILSSSCYVY